jgi:hypothetical protein
MRLTKILVILFSITLIALIYIFQQTEIFQLAYAASKQEMRLKELLDKNNLLRYNINTISSLSYLESSLLSKADFQLPAQAQMVKLQTPPKERITVARAGAKGRKRNLVFNFFNIVPQAEAGDFNH